MSHYLVVALDRGAPEALAGYVADLLEAHVRVSLVLVDEAAVARLSALVPSNPRLSVHPLVAAEPALALPRLARLLGALADRLYVALARPWLLGRRWRTVRAGTDVSTVTRIVAADIGATTLVWRLCRHYPGPIATTALDPPGADPAEPGSRRPPT